VGAGFSVGAGGAVLVAAWTGLSVGVTVGVGQQAVMTTDSRANERNSAVALFILDLLP
jgi:hypothetical protein